jgi:hypothetical protein
MSPTALVTVTGLMEPTVWTRLLATNLTVSLETNAKV